MKSTLRALRGFFYRCLPASRKGFRKKLSGFERRWNLEAAGFTKEGFFGVFRKHFGVDLHRGPFLELVAGDGLVGSLGLWLEAGFKGWEVRAWEHRELVFRQFRQNRPKSLIHLGRLTHWTKENPGTSPQAVCTRGVREAAGVCRAIRKKLIRPDWLGIWNPSRRAAWYHRLHREGYRLELVWQNMEFYRLRSP